VRSCFHGLESNTGHHKIEDDYGDELPQKPREQVPCCATFAITDYKPQGQTFIINNIILDLQSTRCETAGY